MSSLAQRARRLANSNTPTRRRARAPQSASPAPNRQSGGGLGALASRRRSQRRSSSNPPAAVSPTADESIEVVSPPDLGARRNTAFADLDMLDEDMPMDELKDELRRRYKPSAKQFVVAPSSPTKQPVLVTPTKKSLPSPKSMELVDAADRGGGSVHMIPRDELMDDLAQSKPSSLSRLTDAIQGNETIRPQDLKMEEKALWDVVQSALAQTRSESIGKRRFLERQMQDANNQLERARSNNDILQNELASSKSRIETLQGDLRKAQSRSSEDSRRHRASNTIRARRLEEKVELLERKNTEGQELLDAQQEEHDRAIRAIQRVLADVTEQKETQVLALEEKIASIQEEKEQLRKEHIESSSKPVQGGDKDIAMLRARGQRVVDLENEMERIKVLLQRVESQRDSLASDLERKRGNFVIVEQELAVANVSLKQSKERAEHLDNLVKEQKVEIEKLEDELEMLRSESEIRPPTAASADEKDHLIAQLRSQLKESTRILLNQGDGSKTKSRARSIKNIDDLRSALETKEKSLDNAKMLIASLEKANGSMATEMRGKLREKDERVHVLEIEAMERQRTLETLGKELRELRRLQGEKDSSLDEVQMRLSKQKGLASGLEEAITQLQSAAVVHESTAGNGSPDEGVVDQISAILSRILSSLKVNLAILEQSDECESVISGFDAKTDIGGLDPAELNRHLDAIIRHDREAAAKDLRSQLEEQASALQHTESSFNQLKAEIEQLRGENAKLRKAKEEDEVKLNSEIRQLRGQCQTNLEVLTKKEQELQVLRDSLNVNEGVGYISGDESDPEEETTARAVPGVENVDSTNYSATQTEALATLLVHSVTGVDKAQNLSAAEAARTNAELQQARRVNEKVVNELQSEREALANAKMIISSLERANKTMLADLRTRLQDSNTAIASLLDKAQASENNSKSLREQLEKVEEEKKRLEEEHKAEISKLKDGALVDALRLASREKELQGLRTASN